MLDHKHFLDLGDAVLRLVCTHILPGVLQAHLLGDQLRALLGAKNRNVLTRLYQFVRVVPGERDPLLDAV